MNVYEMIDKIIALFREQGIDLEKYAIPASYTTKNDYKIGEKMIYIDPVYRHNGTGEDVTARIKVTEITKIWPAKCCSVKEICKIKVPKNASDKVIRNRVDKAIEAYNR